MTPHRHPANARYDQAPTAAERFARFFGTTKFLAIQSVIVAVWILVNVAVVALRWDPYPFILLNLAFSLQAAYAAPLILLAQNRQDEHDRVRAEHDVEVNETALAMLREIHRHLDPANETPVRCAYCGGDA